MNFTIVRFDTIDSTNSEAAKQAVNGAAEGLCVVAAEQTAGRGRYGRTWISNKNCGVFASIVLRPRVENRYLPLLTLMASIAVYDLLQEVYSLKPDIKWPNDVLIKEKKICGILAETVDTPTGLAVIVGIGINLRSPHLPAEPAQTATSIEAETGEVPDPNEALASLTRFFGYFYDLFLNTDGPQRIVTEWTKRSTYFEGKQVRVVTERETILGTTAGLAYNGALRIATPDGDIRTIQAGDVTSVRAPGL